ncbi:efflux RND transporter periplasmic adaptor subunit [Acuticoccus mangrovi]|uniref:Efflux RND transporter periplasmic adaptor subunit n=1 Tax=Acuticoccus mangrovi TaxID=2796142 RepID=A0A934IW02_9HYPH|nr:efflux RND transporter periplasmic adaptor subunit [Acuticoccus mangrovi]MBJ3778764.1 efflux RND transporter periplasmic adaptor subunit [Acuticoccus mangrovi]
MKGRWEAFLLVLLLAGSVGIAATRIEPRAAPAFATVAIVRGDLEETISAFGKIRPRDYVDVGAQASGQLVRLHVREGDRVAAGDLVAEIDPATQMAQVAADRAEIAELRAELRGLDVRAEHAARLAERTAALALKNVASRQSNDAAQMEAAAAAAQIDAVHARITRTEATLTAHEAELAHTRIHAPMGGTVVSIDVREGQTLIATYETPRLMRIADLSEMTVWTEVAEADVPRLSPGMPVWFTTLGHGERRWKGRLRQILPAPSRREDADTPASPSNAVVFYVALFDVGNGDGLLLPEMSAQVRFVTASADDVVLAPTTALTPHADDGALFTARILGAGGKPEARTVRLGVRTRFQAEIVAGLAAGEHLITGEIDTADASPIRFVP